MKEYFVKAHSIQEQIAKLVEITPIGKNVTTVVGIDVSYRGNLAFGCLVKWDIKKGKIIELVKGKFEVKFPYVSTLLMFREGPAILKLYRESSMDGDVYLINGHGLLHPRYAGLATFFGVVIGKPTIGVAKRLIRGLQAKIVKDVIYLDEREVGVVYRPRGVKRYFYASIGNKVTIGDIRRILRKCDRGFKLPEPLRLAHIESRRMLKNESL